MDSAKPTTRKHCFIEEDDGLAPLADTETGFSGGNGRYPLVSRPLYFNAMQRSSSLRSVSSLSSSAAFVSSQRSANSGTRFYDELPQAHFLDACFLCKKPLGGNKDIFMYKGDTPFCSEECRQEQIEMDEAKEKSWNLSASMKALRKKHKRKSTSPNKSPQDCTFRASTVAAA